VLVEHARTVLRVDDASHAESGDSGTPIVTPLACSLDGQSIQVQLTPGTKVAALYGDPVVTEFTTCNYGLDPARQHIASEGGMAVSGIDDTGEVRVIERTDHPFFVGTLYQPQLRSTPADPHPVWLSFLQACT